VESDLLASLKSRACSSNSPPWSSKPDPAESFRKLHRLQKCKPRNYTIENPYLGSERNHIRILRHRTPLQHGTFIFDLLQQRHDVPSRCFRRLIVCLPSLSPRAHEKPFPLSLHQRAKCRCWRCQTSRVDFLYTSTPEVGCVISSFIWIVKLARYEMLSLNWIRCNQQSKAKRSTPLMRCL
jgi:hypothetical protein